MGALVSQDDLRSALGSGLYLTAAARELGVSRGAVQRAERRHGVALPRAAADVLRFGHGYRDAVQDMKPLEAVEYLLEVIEQLQGPVETVWALPGVHLTRCQKLLTFALAEAAPRVLTRAAAMSAIMRGREADDPPEPKILDVMVCRLRKAFGPLGITITTTWGEGWTLQAPDGFVWPWRVSA